MVSHRRKDPMNLFVNDIILSSQFRDMRINRYARQPEKNLVFAVLEDAVHCLITYQSARRPSLRTLYEDAREWFTTTKEEDTRRPFSFTNVCDILGYEYDVVLRELKPYLHLPITVEKTSIFRTKHILTTALQEKFASEPVVNEHAEYKNVVCVCY